MGKILEQSILDYDENNFSEKIPHPTLITLMCIKGGVTFNETYEKCPKSSPLTLTGVLKTLIGDEKVKIIRKRKIIEKEQPKETVLIVEAEEEFENEEMGGFEDYTEQSVLSPNAKKTILALVRVEERGQIRVEV